MRSPLPVYTYEEALAYQYVADCADVIDSATEIPLMLSARASRGGGRSWTTGNCPRMMATTQKMLSAAVLSVVFSYQRLLHSMFPSPSFHP